MRGVAVNVGITGVQRQMVGLPVYELGAHAHFVVDAVSIRDAVPRDCDHCAIALAAKRQLASPFARIGRAHAYFAVPDSKGTTLEGQGDTKYVVLAGILSKPAQRLMRAVDQEIASAVGEVITIIPRKEAERPENKAIRKRPVTKRPRRKKTKAQRVHEEGVRNYSGRVWK
jgi:hypothetical protein